MCQREGNGPAGVGASRDLAHRKVGTLAVDTRKSSAPHAHPSTEDHNQYERPVRLYACAGCGFRLPFWELVECVEDNHDNLTYFHGDKLCRGCADNAGVCY